MSKRLTLSAQLDLLDAQDDATLLRILADLDRDVVASVGFRWEAKSTQYNQDRVLRLYLKFGKAVERLPDDVEDRDLRFTVFPADQTKVIWLQKA